MGRRFPDAKPGQRIRADHVLAIYEALAEVEFVAVAPLYFGPNRSLCLATKPGFWIKITGAPSGAKHPWVEVLPATGGTWTTGAATGTTSVDSAYELNGSTATLTNKYVRAWRDRASGEVRFQYA